MSVELIALSVITLIAGHGLLAFRDPKGIRPLSLGESSSPAERTVMVASESVAFEGTRHSFTRDIAPGEAVFVALDGTVHAAQRAEATSLEPCLFEYVYLARPDSVMNGISVYQARLEMGDALAAQIQADRGLDDVDVVIPIPESRKQFLGLEYMAAPKI